MPQIDTRKVWMTVRDGGELRRVNGGSKGQRDRRVHAGAVGDAAPSAGVSTLDAMVPVRWVRKLGNTRHKRARSTSSTR